MRTNVDRYKYHNIQKKQQNVRPELYFILANYCCELDHKVALFRPEIKVKSKNVSGGAALTSKVDREEQAD